MDGYLTRFEQVTRKRADPELIRRWEYDASWNGDAKIKNQIAVAKRTATSMRQACAEFINLSPDQDRSIREAAKVLETVAEELTALAAWARDYMEFCFSERAKEEAAELEQIASDRWGNDNEAAKFELDLMRELRTEDGQAAFGAWCHSVGLFPQCATTEIGCIQAVYEVEATDRARAAQTVREARRQSEHELRTTRRGPAAIAAWRDYESYLAYRKEVARSAASIVGAAAKR